MFIHDLQSGETTLVSVNSSGEKANGASLRNSISADGNYIVFQSYADNLVDNDTDGFTDIFIHDRITQKTERVSVSSTGVEGNGNSEFSAVSANGRYVVFNSNASNLVQDDTNGVMDIFVHDRQTGETTRVTASVPDGTQANFLSGVPAISSNGRYIAFSSYASNLDPNCLYNHTDVFLHDRQTGTTTCITKAYNGSPSNGASGGPSLSEDGRLVSFSSASSNLVSNDNNNQGDVFVFDLDNGQVTLVSVSSSGTQGNSISGGTTISGNGQYVSFYSYSRNLVTGDNNGVPDIFVHDLLSKETMRGSVSSSGTEGNGASSMPSISSDGQIVVFDSYASNLVIGDGNNVQDIFVHGWGSMSTPNTISGRVLDRYGNPLQGITVWAGFPDNTQTDLSGNYEFSDLPAGSYNIRPEKDGYHFTPEIITVDVPPGSSEINFTGFAPEDCLLTTDADGDALLDGWEMCGYDHDKDGAVDVDLPAMGASPFHKDIFVEIDYMKAGPNEIESHRPSPSAIAMIVDSFDYSPIQNPDNSTGIHLHVDYGSDAPLRWGQQEYWGQLSNSDALEHQTYINACPELGIFAWLGFDNIRQFADARTPIFHYNIWAHSLCALHPDNSGISRNHILAMKNGASDFVVSLGGFSYQILGPSKVQAGTFMHELGHNLGLQHGGNEGTNYKPNYLSIMNYRFQFNGIIRNGSSGKFDYSSAELPLLNEFALDENIGLSYTGYYEGTVGTVWYCGLLDSTAKVEYDATKADWDCDNTYEPNVIADINGDDALIDRTLTGFNDWNNIVFTGGAVGGLGAGEEMAVETPVDDLTESQAEEIIFTIYNIYLPAISK